MSKVLLAFIAIVHNVQSQCPAWVEVDTIIEGTSGAGCAEEPDQVFEATQGTSATTGLNSCKTQCGSAAWGSNEWIEFYPNSHQTIGGVIRYYYCYCWQSTCTRTRNTRLQNLGNPQVLQYDQDNPCPAPPPPRSPYVSSPPPSPSPPPPCDTPPCPIDDVSSELTAPSLPDDVVEIIMTADGQASDYDGTKIASIKSAFQGALAGMAITVAASDITVTVTDITSRRRHRLLQTSSGVTINTQITLPSSASPSSVKNTLAQPAVSDVLKTGLAAEGITVTAIAITGAGGDEPLSGGIIFLIVFLSILGVCLIVMAIIYMYKKKKQAAAASSSPTFTNTVDMKSSGAA